MHSQKSISEKFLQNRILTISLLLFVFLGAVFFPSAGRDDDYIAYWSAESLLEFGELVNYSGDRVEQGSSIGHIAILAIASSISRLPVPYIGIPVSILSGVLVLLLLAKFKEHFNRRVVNYALLITATSFPFLYWSFAGLETPIYTLALTFLSLFILQISQRPVGVKDYSYLFLVILALQLLRPEAFFVLGLSIGLFWLLKIARETGEKERNTALIQVAIQSAITRFFVLFILLNFAAFFTIATFRYFYFGSIFPQPVIAKVLGIFPGQHSGIPIVPGSIYIIDFFIQNLVLLGSIIVLLGLISRLIKRSIMDRHNTLDILIAIFLSQFTFILLSGPDWMEGFRFIAPVLPILSLSAAVFYNELCPKNSNIEKLLVAILICMQTTGFLYFVINSSSSAPLWATRNNIPQAIAGAQNYPWFARVNTNHIRDIPVAEALNKTISQLESVVANRPIVIMSSQAGFVIYHVAKKNYGKIHFLDLASLSNNFITECPPLKKDTRRLREEAARKYGLGDLEVASHLIMESDKLQTCHSPRPDVIYMLGGEIEFSPRFKELEYELAFSNTGSISLDFGKKEFYGGYLIDRALFEQAGLEFERSHISVKY